MAVHQIAESRALRVRHEQEAQVVLMGRKQGNHLLGAAFGKPQVQFPLFPVSCEFIVKRGQHHRHVAAVVRRHTQRMLPLLAADGGEHLGVPERPERIAVSPLPGLGQLHAVGAAREKPRPKLLLQLADHHADMGLRREKLLRRRGQRTAARAGQKILKMAKFHASS